MEYKKFGDLPFKDKIAIITAIASFSIGWILTILAFYTEPIGEVHSSVEWILGQSLIYTASVLGIGMYFSSESLRLRNDLKNFVNQRVKEYEGQNDVSFDAGTYK